MWKKGMTARIEPEPSRPSGNQARTWSVFATSARCESIANFGTPVVPPVGKSAARSLGSIATGAGLVAMRSRSWNRRTRASPLVSAWCPSLRSLAIVKSVRSSGGMYSLMFVTITCFTVGVCAAMLFTAGYRRDRTTTVAAPLSLKWCVISRGV
jgi:hypothetical protein